METIQKAPEDFSSWASQVSSTFSGHTFALERADDILVAPGREPMLGTSNQLSAISELRQQLLTTIPSKTILPPAGTHADSSKNIPMDRAGKEGSKPLTHIESHSAQCHQLATRIILSRHFTPCSTIERNLQALMKTVGLTSNINSGGDSLITSFGLTFCMASVGQQWWWLLWGAMVATARSFQETSPTDDILRDFFPILRTFGATDSGLVYKIPTNHVARKLLNPLSLVGLCLPFKRAGKEYFLISPFFRLALSHSKSLNTYCSVTLRDACGLSASTGKTLSSKRVRIFTTGCKRGRIESLADCVSIVAESTISGKFEVENIRVKHDGSVVTETNFRLYVYSCSSGHLDDPLTSSTLLNIVSQFSDHDVTIPHRHSNELANVETFSVFRLTRPAFARAHRRGITARHIIEFLTLKAHPTAPTPVPTSVQDQLWMWQETCERAEWNDVEDPVVMLAFVNEETLERVIGLGVNILHRQGLRVTLSLSQFVSQCQVGIS